MAHFGVAFWLCHVDVDGVMRLLSLIRTYIRMNYLWIEEIYNKIVFSKIEELEMSSVTHRPPQIVSYSKIFFHSNAVWQVLMRS